MTISSKNANPTKILAQAATGDIDEKNASFCQDAFLNALIEQQTIVYIYLTNGIKLKGRITAFDKWSVILTEATSQMVYKHSISTVIPDHQ